MSTSNDAGVAPEPNAAKTEQVYHEAAAHREACSRRAAAADASHLMPHLRPGLRLEDFGCGTNSLSLGFAREPQKEGDWFGGPHREAITLYNQALIDDRFRSAGGDPFIGRRLAALFLEAGFQRLESKPRNLRL